jgi:hypothetical protein
MNEKTERAKWAEALAYDADFAEKTLIERGEVLPMFVIHAAGALYILNASFESDAAKQRAYSIVQVMAIAHAADAVSMIAEAWVRSVPQRHGESEAEWRKRGTDVMPSQAEDRIEVVSVVLGYRGKTSDRHTLHSLREIIRGDDGKPTGLKPDDTQERGKPGGIMADLVPRVPPSPGERAEAQALLKLVALDMEMIPIHKPGHA